MAQSILTIALLATLPLVQQTGISLAWLGLVGGVAWGVHQAQLGSTELTRKVVHIGTGNVILLAWWLQIPAWVGIMASLLFSIVALLSYFFPLLPGIKSVGRRSWGTFFYAVSIGLLVAWFWPLHLPQFAVVGVLVMTWGDGLAAIVGQRWGKHPYQLWGMNKSLEGSLTMTIVSGIVSAIVLMTLPLPGMVIFGIAIAVAITSTILEAFSKLGLDNLTVPLGAAACSFWLSQGYL
ncbi:MAG: diacylglycerol/polyprenol kinase family protein [Prochlorotrichaceae cyanobacterium]